eukprot:11226439-Lingulodinium_polyedra.AAC.1
MPEFETCNPHLETLHCDKPGTGLRDALAAFSCKLSSVTDQTGAQTPARRPRGRRAPQRRTT